MEHETWAVWPWKAKISANHSLLNFLWSHRKGRTHKYWGNQSWGNTVWKCMHCRVRTPDIHVVMFNYHNIKKKKTQPLTQGNFRAGVLMKQAIFSNCRPCFASVRGSWRRPSHRGPPSLVLCTAAPQRQSETEMKGREPTAKNVIPSLHSSFLQLHVGNNLL